MSEITRDQMVTEEDGVRQIGLPGSAGAPPLPAPQARRHLGELFRKVDAVFARARARYRNQMACSSGCTDCCQRQISVTGAEAALIRAALAALTPEAQREVERRAALAKTSCPALAEGGGCAIYAARPLACRTYGMPLRLGPQPGVRSLPVLEACAKNFVGQDLSKVDAAAVLDMRTMAAALDAIDETYAGEAGRPRGERIELTALFASAPAA